jgi:hypothetical protein
MTYSPFIRYCSTTGDRHYFEPLKDLFDPSRSFKELLTAEIAENRAEIAENANTLLFCVVCVLYLAKNFEVFGFLCVLGY